MKKLLTISNTRHLSISFWRTVFLTFVGMTLALAFWTATTPVAKAREMTPRDMIQAQLPQGKTLANATKPQVLSAVCSAIKKYRRDAAQIVRTAAEARRDLLKEIERRAFECAGTDDAALIRGVVDGLIAAFPDEAAAIRDLAIQLAPSVMGGGSTVGSASEGNFNNDSPSNQNPPPGSLGGGGGGFNPEEGRCIVCHNGHEIRVPCSKLTQYLTNHPGDKAGPCQPTPTKNQ